MLSRNAKRTILGLAVAAAGIMLFAAAVRHYFEARALEIRLEQERAELVPPEPLLVEAQRMDLSRKRNYGVKLEPFHRTRVAAEAGGRIVSFPFETGERVEEGEVLARLDDRLAALTLDATEASLEASRAQVRELERREREAEALAAEQSIPRTELEAIRAELETRTMETIRLEAEVERNRELLERHKIRAPFDGIIDRRLVERGDTVNPNEPIATLVDLDPLRARFYISDRELSAFSNGQEITIRLTGETEETVAGEIASIGRAADPVTGLFTVEAWTENPEWETPGGLHGTVSAEVHHYRDALFIPAAAIRFDGAAAVATVQADGRREIRQLRLGPELDGYFPVLDGLVEGEQVAIE